MSEGAPTLRPYQAAAIEAIRDRYRAGERATLLHLATGLGKTVTFAEIIRLVADRGGRSLVLAHRRELLDQAAAKLEAVGVRAGIEQGKRRAGDEPAVVASVQTMQRKRLESWPAGAFRLVVVDEAHHAAAKSYINVLDRFAREGGALVLGVTATPFRADRKGLAEVFESIAYSYGLREGIGDGYLAPLRPRRIVVDSVDLDGVKIRGGDFVAGELDDAYSQEAALHAVAKPLVEQVGERQALVFAAGVAHAHKLADVINSYREGAAIALSGNTPDEERLTEIAAFKSGHRQMLVNAQLFTEGTDLPTCSAIAIARSTKSLVLYTQIVGRGTRLAPGKSDCLVLDFIGVTERHKLASTVRLMADETADDELIEIAEEILADDPQLSIEVALEAAEGLSERRAKIARAAARVEYYSRVVDLFGGSAGRVSKQQWAGDPATDKQVDLLTKHGLEAGEWMTKGEASALIDVVNERHEQGLCTYKQARFLKRYGFETTDLSKDAATQLFLAIKNNGFRCPAHLDPRRRREAQEVADVA